MRTTRELAGQLGEMEYVSTVSLGTLLRRNFEPVVLSVQVIVDLLVLILACWIGYMVGERLGGLGPEVRHELYQKLSALIAAVCLVSFHAFGLYKPTKSLLTHWRG